MNSRKKKENKKSGGGEEGGGADPLQVKALFLPSLSSKVPRGNNEKIIIF